MSELALSSGLLDIRSGELIDPTDAPRVAALLADVREHARQLTELRRACEQALAEEARRQGTKTLRFEGVEAVVSGGEASELVWDIEELQKLLDAGLPSERFEALVRETVEYRVNAAVAKQIAAANDEYAAIVERARSYRDKPVYVTVRQR